LLPFKVDLLNLFFAYIIVLLSNFKNIHITHAWPQRAHISLNFASFAFK
jgi:hypothetical protein